MVRTRSQKLMTKAAAPKRKATQCKSKSKSKRKAAAISSEQEKLKRMAAAACVVDVDKILRLKREVYEVLETNSKLAAAGQTLQSGAEEEKAPPKKKKKKEVVVHLISQGYIDYMKTVGLFHGIDKIPEDELAKRSQYFCDYYRGKVLLAEKLRACQQVLLDQYDAFGYAYDANEVTDDEAEDEDEDEDEDEGVLVVEN